jgi:hypothetical protein
MKEISVPYKETEYYHGLTTLLDQMTLQGDKYNPFLHSWIYKRGPNLIVLCPFCRHITLKLYGETNSLSWVNDFQPGKRECCHGSEEETLMALVLSVCLIKALQTWYEKQ